MPIFDFRANGKIYSFRAPEGTDPQTLLPYVQQQIAAETRQAGFWKSFGEGATTLGSLPEAAKFGLTNTPEARQALIADQTPENAKTSWADVKDIPSFVNWARQTAGTSMGYLAVPGAAGAIAQGLSKTPGVGKAVGLGLLGTQYLTENLGRQAGEQQVAAEQGQSVRPASIGRAALAAAGQTGLDVVGFEFFKPVFKALPFVGKLFGAEGTVAAQKATEQFADAIAKGAIKYSENIAIGVGKGVAFEVPQEIAQQALERWQAGLPLTDENARREYGEAMAGAVLLGGGLGGLQGAVETHTAHEEARQAVTQKDAEKAALAQKARDAAVKKSVTPSDTGGGKLVPAKATVKAQNVEQKQAEELKRQEQIASGAVGLGGNFDEELPGGFDSAKVYENQVLEKAYQGLVKHAAGKDTFTSDGAINAIKAATGVTDYVRARAIYTSLEARGLISKKDTATKTRKLLRVPPKEDAANATSTPTGLAPQADAEATGASTGVPAQATGTDAVPAEGTQSVGLDDTRSGIGGSPEGEVGVSPALKPERPEGRIIGPEIQLTDAERAALDAAPNVAEKWAAEPKLDAGTLAFLDNVKRVKERIPERSDTLLARNRLNTIEQNIRRGAPITERDVTDLQKFDKRFPVAPKTTEVAPETAAQLEPGTPIPDIVQEFEKGEPAKDEVIFVPDKRKPGQVKEVKAPGMMQRVLSRLAETENPVIRALAFEMLGEVVDESRNVSEAEAFPQDVRTAEAAMHTRKPLHKNSPYLSPAHFKADKSYAKGVRFFRPKVIVEGSTTLDDTATIDRLKAEGKVAEYDASKNTLAFTQEGLTDKIIAHELLHAYTVRVLRQYVKDKTKLTPEQVDGARQVYRIFEVAKKRLADKYPDAFSNIYEFVSYSMTEPQMQADLKEIKVSPFYTESVKSRPKETALQTKQRGISLWSKLTRAIAEMIGLRKGEKAVKGDAFVGNALLELTQAVSDIMTIPGKTTGVGKLAARAQATVMAAPALETRSTTEIIDDAQLKLEEVHKPFTARQAVKFFLGTMPGYERLVKDLQNDRRPLKLLQDVLWMAGKLVVGKNNIYDALTLSTQVAHWAMTNHLMEPMDRVNNAVALYAKARGISTERALAELDTYFVAEHEQERRHQKYLRFVPLDANEYTKFKISALDDVARTAFEHRKHIYERLLAEAKEVPEADRLPPKDQPEARAARIRQLRQIVEELVEGYRDVEGSTDLAKGLNADQKADPASLEESSNLYDVLSFGQEELAALREEFAQRRREHGSIIEQLHTAMHDLSEQTIKLNKDANYWSPQVDNFQQFYAWKNYVPLKGKPEFNEDSEEGTFERFTSKTGGGYEYVESQEGFMGRKSMADNVILQTMVDGAKSALRYGRKDVAPTLKNLIDTKYIRGKSADTGSSKADRIITFAERYTANSNALEKIDENSILYYRDDGTIEILKIDPSDRRYREAIRRAYREPTPLLNLANNITGFMGHMHTRYNPAFAPYNFVRDMLTNAFKIGAEYGPLKAGQYVSAVAARIASGGMGVAARISRLYHTGRIAEIEDMTRERGANGQLTPRAKQAQELYDYMRVGGRVAYIMGVAHKGQLNELLKDANTSDLKQRMRKVNNYIDVWADMFEFTARAGAYAVFKAHYMTPEGGGLSEVQATQRAAAEAKNLANFEQVGKYGREAGALFMFFRPAATGAVAALDSVRQIWWNEQKFIEELPNVLAQTDAPGDPRGQLAAKHREMKRNAQLMLGGLAGAGFMIYTMALLAGDEDEPDEFGRFKRNKILRDDPALWTRNMRLPMSFIDKDSKTVLQIPWGFGLGAVGATGAQVAALSYGAQDFGDFLGNMTNIALDSFVPIPVSRINPMENPGAWVVDSAMPSMLRPLVEFTMNKDGLGREIYNNRVTKYGDAALGGMNVPEGFHQAARLLRDITNGEVNVQPNSLYFWANNYLDGLSRITQSLYGLGLVAAGDKQFEAKSEIMLLSSYLGRESNYDARMFALVQKQIEKKEAILNQFSSPDAQPQRDRYLERDPYAPVAVYMFRKVESGLLRNIRKEINETKASNTLSAKERKERVDWLNERQNYIKFKLMEQLAEYGVTPYTKLETPVTR